MYPRIIRCLVTTCHCDMTLMFPLQDCQSKMKDKFKGIPDEFMTNEAALKAKVSIVIPRIHFHFLYTSKLVFFCSRNWLPWTRRCSTQAVALTSAA